MGLLAPPRFSSPAVLALPLTTPPSLACRPGQCPSARSRHAGQAATGRVTVPIFGQLYRAGNASLQWTCGGRKSARAVAGATHAHGTPLRLLSPSALELAGLPGSGATWMTTADNAAGATTMPWSASPRPPAPAYPMRSLAQPSPTSSTSSPQPPPRSADPTTSSGSHPASSSPPPRRPLAQQRHRHAHRNQRSQSARRPGQRPPSRLVPSAGRGLQPRVLRSRRLGNAGPCERHVASRAGRRGGLSRCHAGLPDAARQRAHKQAWQLGFGGGSRGGAGVERSGSVVRVA